MIKNKIILLEFKDSLGLNLQTYIGWKNCSFTEQNKPKTTALLNLRKSEGVQIWNEQTKQLSIVNSSLLKNSELNGVIHIKGPQSYL